MKNSFVFIDKLLLNRDFSVVTYAIQKTPS